MKISIIDLETTGLNPRIHEIIEVVCIVFDDETFEVENILDVKVKPEYPNLGNKEAYKINGYKKEDWRKAQPLEKVMKKLAKLTKDTMFCAHNMIFDWSFLQEASKKTGVSLSFGHRKIDLFTMAWTALDHSRMPKFSLHYICEALGIPPEPEIHRAINGAMCEFEVYKKIMR